MTMMYGGCKLKPKVKELEAKLAALEKERDAERAHNAVLRGALELVEYRGTSYYPYGEPQPACLECGEELSHSEDCPIGKALNKTPSDSAERVKALVDFVEAEAKNGMRGWIKQSAQKALAEWRGE